MLLYARHTLQAFKILHFELASWPRLSTTHRHLATLLSLKNVKRRFQISWSSLYSVHLWDDSQLLLSSWKHMHSYLAHGECALQSSSSVSVVEYSIKHYFEYTKVPTSAVPGSAQLHRSPRLWPDNYFPKPSSLNTITDSKTWDFNLAWAKQHAVNC